MQFASKWEPLKLLQFLFGKEEVKWTHQKYIQIDQKYVALLIAVEKLTLILFPMQACNRCFPIIRMYYLWLRDKHINDINQYCALLTRKCDISIIWWYCDMIDWAECVWNQQQKLAWAPLKYVNAARCCTAHNVILRRIEASVLEKNRKIITIWNFA